MPIHANVFWSCEDVNTTFLQLPTLIDCCLQSWVLHGHTISIWSDKRLLTSDMLAKHSNVHIRSIASILTLQDQHVLNTIDRKLVQTDTHANVAMTTKANYIRLRILQEQPMSYWIDSDIICLSPDMPSTVFQSMISLEKSDVFDASHVFPGMSPTNMFLQFNNQHLLATVIDKLREFIATKDQIRRGKTGPSFIRSMFIDKTDEPATLSLQNCMLLDPSVFCPINWHEMDMFYKSMSELDLETLSRSKGLHLWYSMLDQSLLSDGSIIKHLLNQIQNKQAPTI